MADRSDARAALRRQLGADLTVLDELSEAECAELLEMIAEVRETQRQALDRSLNQVLGNLPRLVRGPARKILFG